MADPKAGSKGGGGSEDAVARIARLELCVVEIERARKQRSIIGVCGMLLLLLAIALFAVKLWTLGKDLVQPVSQQAIMAKVQEDLVDLLQNDPQLKELMSEFRNDLLPSAAAQVSAKLKEELPTYRKQGEAVLDNLQVYFKKDVADKLHEALVDIMADIEERLLEKYPQVTSEELQTVVERTRVIFLEEMTALIERKLELVSDDLGSLQASIDGFKDTPEYREMIEALAINREGAVSKAQLAMIEDMLELVIYHINPERGAELAISATAPVVAQKLNPEPTAVAVPVGGAK